MSITFERLFVLANFLGESRPFAEEWTPHTSFNVSEGAIDLIIKPMRPSLHFPVPNTLNGSGTLRVELEFCSLSDFAGDSLARGCPALVHLARVRDKLLAGAEELEVVGPASLLIDFIEDRNMGYEAQRLSADISSSDDTQVTFLEKFACALGLRLLFYGT